LQPLSVIQPLTPAIQRTRRILFEPFQLSRWLRLGFCAFLTGSSPMGGFGAGSPSDLFDSDSNSDSGSRAAASLFAGAVPWILQHQTLILSVAAIVAAVLLLLVVLLIWLSSRGHFMLLDGVVRNRGAIGAPWRQYRREANSLFRFRIAMGLVGLLVVIALVAMPLLLGFGGEWRAEIWTVWFMVLVFASGLALVVWILALLLISTLLVDFVVPVMYRHRLPAWPAWKIVIRQLVLQHPGAVALYFVARFLLNSAVGIAAGMATLLSCCLALVPYLGSVILLPLSVFQLNYPLAFLEQLGPDWRLFPPDPPPADHQPPAALAPQA
jgi:hypothetical protein